MKQEEKFEESGRSDFLIKVAERFCPGCGKVVSQNKTGRPKKFCSDKCRLKWWHTHPMPDHWEAAEQKLCPICGRPFTAVRQTGRARVYCCRACSNRSRGRKYRVNGGEECDPNA